ncbi:MULTISPECIES: JAB domain-containing protein [unclassified Ruminococcus]|uniref:JAB domain-containing protein n=2 Tax=Ruminococcus TaxID=1263 RepID=UPI001A9ADB91|nr:MULTISPECIES: JAB domain-containing protein [unclassified Ruminococcus]
MFTVKGLWLEIAEALLISNERAIMNIRKYETRLNGNGFVTLDLVFSKYIPEIENSFTNSEKVYQLCRTMEWDTYSEEHVFLLSFNMKFRLKAFFEIGIGNNDTCLVDRRGIAQKILLSNAAKMIMVHNHPSGDPTPSKEDLNVSNELKKLGELLGIPFVDSIILGDWVYKSFAEEGIL